MSEKKEKATMVRNPEVVAMDKIAKIFQSLTDDGARRRVWQWCAEVCDPRPAMKVINPKVNPDAAGQAP